MKLRSGSLKRGVSSRVDLGHNDGSLSKVDIPDLNLVNASDAIVSVESGVGSDKIQGKSDDFECEKGTGPEDDCEGLYANNKNIGDQKCNDIRIFEGSSIEAGRFPDVLQPLANVGVEGNEIGGEILNCAVGLGSLSACPSLGVVVKSSKNDVEKMVCQGDEEELKETSSEGVSTPFCVNGKYKDESKKGRKACGLDMSINEQTNFGDLKECSEKNSVLQWSRGKLGESLEGEVKKGRIQVVGKVLRSRFVPGNGSRDEAVDICTRASSSKRKRKYNGEEVTKPVTRKNGTNSLPVDSTKTPDSLRPIDLFNWEVLELDRAPRLSNTEDEDANQKSVKRSVIKKKCGSPEKSMHHSQEQARHMNGEVVELNKVPHMSKTGDEDANEKPVRSSRKRGRPQKSIYHSQEQACHMNEVQAVSEVEDEDLNCRSTPSLTENECGNPEIVEKGEESKVENDGGDTSKKSVGCSTLTRRREPSKRFVDYYENDAVDDDPEDRKAIVGSRTGAFLNKKGKRGRPKKEEGHGAVEKASQDKNVKIRTSKGEEDTLLAEYAVRAKRNKGEERLRAVEKDAIRNQILDMLLHAGWTVQYRPRKRGRKCCDAVYFNREGKTHWSVTQAYRKLKQEFEDGKVGDFIPLPEELLSKLFKVVSKTRSDKNKKKKHKGDSDCSVEDDSGDKLGNKSGDKHKHPSLKLKLSVKGGRQSKTRCALIARISNGLNSESCGPKAPSGKHSIFAWMIDSGALDLDAKVHFMNCHKTKAIVKGSITRDGIHCQCCKEVISVSEFEKHSGSKCCRSYENLYLESGQSLLQCLLDSWNKQETAGCIGFHRVNLDANDPNDDICAICGDGGELMCCDSCPSSFHHSCLKMEEVPLGEWNCVHCSCKFCGTVGEAIDDCDPASSSLVSCSFCERKYHQSCVNDEDVVHLKSGRRTFCDKTCQQIFDRLQKLYGVKGDLEDGYSWTLLQRSDVKADDVLLESRNIQDNSKLAVALSVMDECFVPIIDPKSGINLIRHVVYNCGSNFNRLNFGSFCTIVLEKGDEAISAASVRILGKQFAEMPFIGTRNVYRRQGMCRRLLTAIERALNFLDIENLVIPAAPELLDMWTSVFGFEPMRDTVKKYTSSMNMVVFAHTDMLQKPLSKHDLGGERCIAFVENDSNCLKSSDEKLSDGADRYEVVDSSVNDLFDLNVVARGIPESSSDELHASCISERCGVDGKSRNGVGELGDSGNVQGQPSANVNIDTQGGHFIPVPNCFEKRTLQLVLYLMVEDMCGSSVDPDYVEPSSDVTCPIHPCSAIGSSDQTTENIRDSCNLPKLDSCCTVENYPDCGGNSGFLRNTFGERTLNPGLTLTRDNVLKLNHCSQPSAVNHKKIKVCCFPGTSDSCENENIPCGEAVHLSSLDASSEAVIHHSDVNTTDNHEVLTVPLGTVNDFGSEVSFNAECEFLETNKPNTMSDRTGVSSNGKSIATDLFDCNGISKFGSN